MRGMEEEVRKKGRENEGKGDESGGDHPSHLSPSTARLIRDAISNDSGVPTTRRGGGDGPGAVRHACVRLGSSLE